MEFTCFYLRKTLSVSGSIDTLDKYARSQNTESLIKQKQWSGSAVGEAGTLSQMYTSDPYDGLFGPIVSRNRLECI